VGQQETVNQEQGAAYRKSYQTLQRYPCRFWFVFYFWSRRMLLLRALRLHVREPSLVARAYGFPSAQVGAAVKLSMRQSASGQRCFPCRKTPLLGKHRKGMSWHARRLAKGLWLVHLRGGRLVLHMPSPNPHLPKRPATSAQGTSRSIGGDASSASSASSATSNARTNPAPQETGAAQTGSSTGRELSARGR